MIGTGHFGQDSYGDSPYGGAVPLYGIGEVQVISDTLLRVVYTSYFDTGFAPLTDASNYSLTPSTSIYSVTVESPYTLILNVAPLSGGQYTLTVTQGLGYYNEPLDLSLASFTFTIAAGASGVVIHAIADRRVRIQFPLPMDLNAQYLNPASYQISTLSPSAPISILTVTSEQITAPYRSIILGLDQDMRDERQYLVSIGAGIQTLTALDMSGDTIFTRSENHLQTSVRVRDLQPGTHPLLPPGNQIFFSPALEVSAPNSVIQIESVAVCSQVEDSYRFPSQGATATGLKTFGPSLLNQGRLTPRRHSPEISIGVAVTSSETVSAPSEALPIGSMTETHPVSIGSLLNQTAWKMYHPSNAPTVHFRISNNLAPAPPPVTTPVTIIPGTA